MWTTPQSFAAAVMHIGLEDYLTINFGVRSLPVEAGGSQYELIAIATDVEQIVNEGSDGIEHMYVVNLLMSYEDGLISLLLAGYVATETRMCLLTQNHLVSLLIGKLTLTFMEKRTPWGKLCFCIVEFNHTYPSAQ